MTNLGETTSIKWMPTVTKLSAQYSRVRVIKKQFWELQRLIWGPLITNFTALFTVLEIVVLVSKM